MKAVQLKRLSVLICCLSFILAAAQPVSADNKPYVKAFGADVRTGGWFYNGNTACATDINSNYQDENFTSAAFPVDSNTPNSGGILTYANQDGSGVPTGGSSSQYAVTALGVVNGSTSSDGYGFYSDGAVASVSRSNLTFANSDITYPWGGVFEAGIRDLSSCMPDYYNQVNSAASTSPLPNNARGILSSGGLNDNKVYTGSQSDPANALQLTNGAGDITLNPGKRITIYIDGDVWLTNNIVYDNTASVDQAPKFMLVVRGNIYVNPSVTRLDGFYIAQPKDSTPASVNTDTGIFWTCHPQATAILDYTYPAANCNSQLVINGAVAAKQVNLMRTLGDIGSSNRTEDSSASAATNTAEVFNYSPWLIVNGALNITNPSATSALPIDSIYSLPPAF